MQAAFGGVKTKGWKLEVPRNQGFIWAWRCFFLCFFYKDDVELSCWFRGGVLFFTGKKLLKQKERGHIYSGNHMEWKLPTKNRGESSKNGHSIYVSKNLWIHWMKLFL